LKKKLLKVSKKKGCDDLEPWIRSINNHLYWAACSSETGEEVVDKVKSISNHVMNIHQHDSDRFPACTHGPISRNWLKVCKLRQNNTSGYALILNPFNLCQKLTYFCARYL